MKKKTSKAIQETIDYVRKCEQMKDYPFSFCRKDLVTIIQFLELKLRENNENNNL